MKRNSIFAFIVVIGVLLSSCGGGGAGRGTNTTELEGTWNTKCTNSGSGTYSNRSLIVSGYTYKFIYRTYTNSSCSTVATTAYSESGTFVIGDSITTITGLSAKKVDAIILNENGNNVNDKQYNIYRLDHQNLYLGDTSRWLYGGSEDIRPNDLDFTNYYTKKY